MAASKLPTPRKLAVYLGVAAVLVCASPEPPTFFAGAALGFLGVLLRVWGCGHLEKNQVLVTTGPYAYVKNPLYVGSFLVSAGGLLAAGSPGGRGFWVWAALGPAFAILFFVSYLPRKKSVEGERLARKFGDDFARFDRAVPDFIPRIAPYRSGDGRRWSAKVFWSNNEIGMDFLIAAVFAAIWFLPQYVRHF